MTNPQTRSADFGLIGYPLGHSFSKMFFTRLFTEDGSGRVYENFELPELTSESLYNIILMNPDLIGFNVTAPYKQAIIPFLDSVDELASEVGAVNTVKIIRADGGRLKALEGYNTDVRGFGESVASFLGEARPAALILGTGGASHAVEVALHRMGICTTLVSRSKKGQGIITYDDIDAATLRDNQFIVNATPLGTFRTPTVCRRCRTTFLHRLTIASISSTIPAQRCLCREPGSREPKCATGLICCSFRQWLLLKSGQNH